tara:strand:+ start:3613 stop:4401 length:789 start_codon:yes stop_codon:yes gene_type:complete
MGDSDFKKINVGESFMQYKSTKPRQSRNNHKNRSNNISQLRPLSVKELLLQKLKQYKKEKTRKNRDVSQKNVDLQDNITPSLNATFSTKTGDFKRSNILPPVINNNYRNNYYRNNNDNNSNVGLYKPSHNEYGNMKYGMKPTYRQVQRNKTRKLKHETAKKKIKLEIEKKFNLGKNVTQKRVGVFIKNHKLRRQTNDEKVNIKNSNIKTVKNYLKGQNLIRYGTHSPNELLREIYLSSKLCGDVYNINGQSLIHNYMNDEEL